MANCLGPFALKAFNGLTQINERNVETEMQSSMIPLIKKLRNHFINLVDKQSYKEDFNNDKE